MSKQRRTTSPILPAPTGGLNVRTPRPLLDPIYTPAMINMECENESVRVRDGFQIHAICDAQVLGLGAYLPSSVSNSKLFAYTNESPREIFDVTTSTPSSVHTLGSGTADEAYPFNMSGRFGFGVESAASTDSAYWDGSSWTNWNFTSVSVNETTVQYKGRVYSFAGRTYRYGGVGAVSGATTSVSLDSVFELPGSIRWAKKISNFNQTTDQVYLAIGNESGEVLVYQGEFPGDSTWGLAARYYIPACLPTNCAFEFANDVWIFTKSSIVSLRALFGSQRGLPEEYSVSYNIDPLWENLARINSNNYISAAYWPERNKVYILINAEVNQDVSGYPDAGNDNATLLSYNLTTQAWSLSVFTETFASFPYVGGLTYYQNGLYFHSYTNIYKLVPGSFKDEVFNDEDNFQAFQYELESADTAFSDTVNSKRVQGLKPIIETDFDGTSVGFQVSGDFGVESSTSDQNDLTDGFNNIYYSVGTEGDFIAYKLIGNSDTDATDGLRLYAIGILVEPGGTR